MWITSCSFSKESMPAPPIMPFSIPTINALVSIISPRDVLIINTPFLSVFHNFLQPLSYDILLVCVQAFDIHLK